MFSRSITDGGGSLSEATTHSPRTQGVGAVYPDLFESIQKSGRKIPGELSTERLFLVPGCAQMADLHNVTTNPGAIHILRGVPRAVVARTLIPHR